MQSAPIITVENLGKRYELGAAQKNERYTTLRDSIANAASGLFRRDSRSKRDSTAEAFWALKDVSFEIQRGDVVGIIGRNGAGKSTLLKILSRITEPTRGRITLEGRVASLLEVGTGFHPELTGRENIFLNGAILGMSRVEIKAKFDEIVAFAEVERFLDTPVKRYSSGMYVRLAFAVAAHLEPEILIVDEVLAVGDAEFQKKCLGKMEDISKKQGRTVIFVSHQMNAVQALCTSCLLLVKGQVQSAGKPASVIGEYLHTDASTKEWKNPGDEFANHYFQPTRFSLVDQDLRPLPGDRRADEKIGVLLEGTIVALDSALVIGFAIYNQDGTLLYWSVQTDTAPTEWPQLHLGMNRMVCWLPQHMLNEGEYRVELIVSLHCRAWFCQPGVNAPAVHFKLRGGLSQSPHWMEARPGQLAPILPFASLSV